MIRCLIFDGKSRLDLQDKINAWLESMKDVPMFDLKFHYAVFGRKRSVLVTYHKEEN